MRHDLNADMDAGAAAAAEGFGMGNALFKDIPIGASFRFKADTAPNVKVSATHYTTAQGYRFSTGQRAAVFR